MKMLTAIRQRRVWLPVAVGLVVIVVGVWLFEARSTSPIDSFAACAEAGYPITESFPPVCHVGKHSFVDRSEVAPTPPPAVTGDSVPFKILVDGDSRGNYPQRNEVITTQASWEQYWASVHAGLGAVPPLIPVDFSKNAVVAVSAGQQATAGYSLRITNVTATGHGSVIDLSITIPTITCKVSSTPNNPYYIVQTPHLAEPVTFRTSTDYHHCS